MCVCFVVFVNISPFIAYFLGIMQSTCQVVSRSAIFQIVLPSVVIEVSIGTIRVLNNVINMFGSAIYMLYVYIVINM